MAEKLPPLFAEAIVNSVGKILSKCVEMNLKCMDPPSVITPLLRCLGYNEYEIRRFWSFFEKNKGSLSFEIYRYSSVKFSLSFIYRKEAVMHLREDCIPVDELDYQRLKPQCVRTPHSHALYMYIEGEIGDSHMRLNVVNALYLLYLRNSKIVDKLLDTLIDIAWGRAKTSELYEKVLEAIGIGSDVLKFILPSIPTTLKELLKISPILRRKSRLK